MSLSIKTISVITLLIALAGFFLFNSTQNQLPVIAIANWGPHHSLDETLKGIKDELARLDLKENKDFVYDIQHVNFEPTLIQQMLAKLKAKNPKVLITVSTPIAQAAKKIKHIPIVFTDVTDPLDANLLVDESKPIENITGASDRQNLESFLQFAKILLPKAKKIGVLYSTGEANDAALVKMMKKAAEKFDMIVVAIAIDKPSDVPQRMQAFKDKVDFIYVGVSGAIQPTLPVVVLEANKMKIPVFNADFDAVKQHQVLGSYGVSYYQVGVNTAQIVYQIFKGEKPANIAPKYPVSTDHHGYISKKVAEKFGIEIPQDLTNITVVG